MLRGEERRQPLEEEVLDGRGHGVHRDIKACQVYCLEKRGMHDVLFTCTARVNRPRPCCRCNKFLVTGPRKGVRNRVCERDDPGCKNKK